MTVQELIDELAKFPKDHQVILARDGEGNGFSPLEGAVGLTGERYEPDSAWSGTLRDVEDVVDGEGDNAVVFWPTN